jgi:hypothetical protein
MYLTLLSLLLSWFRTGFSGWRLLMLFSFHRLRWDRNLHAICSHVCLTCSSCIISPSPSWRHSIIQQRHNIIIRRHSTCNWRHSLNIWRHSVSDLRYRSLDWRHRILDWRHITLDWRHSIHFTGIVCIQGIAQGLYMRCAFTEYVDFSNPSCQIHLVATVAITSVYHGARRKMCISIYHSGVNVQIP